MSSEVEVQTENQVDDDPGGTEGKVMATLINGYIWIVDNRFKSN